MHVCRQHAGQGASGGRNIHATLGLDRRLQKGLYLGVGISLSADKACGTCSTLACARRAARISCCLRAADGKGTEAWPEHHGWLLQLCAGWWVCGRLMIGQVMVSLSLLSEAGHASSSADFLQATGCG